MLFLKASPTTDVAAWHKEIESLASELADYDEQVKVCKANLDSAREVPNAKRGRLKPYLLKCRKTQKS